METDRQSQLAEALARATSRHLGRAVRVEALEHLSGGASRETWAFDAVDPDGILPLILRRDPESEAKAAQDALGERMDRATEYAVIAAVAAAGRPVAVMGYCMGGNLALALALRRQGAVSRLALLATPWDFHADNPTEARALAAGMTPFWPLVEGLGEMPVDLLQVLFSALDPYLAVKKFLAFGRLDPATAKAAHFVALEDWLNDGVPLVAAVARECLAGWYGENSPAAGKWRIAGVPVRPQALDVPALAIVPAQDRIVPPASAVALADAIPGCERMTPALGHIGMVVGGTAPKTVWGPLVDWLRGDAALA